MALKRQKGSILVEFAVSCLLLVVFFFGMVEVWSMVRDKVYLQRIVRDATREAAVTGDVSSGYGVAQDRARQYFGQAANRCIVILETDEQPGSHLVIGEGKFGHRPFGSISEKLWGKEVTLRARAVFGWYDFRHK